MYDKPPTRLAQALADRRRSASWLARKLQITPQSLHSWLHATEACPRNRRAQIVLILNEDDLGQKVTTDFLFDAEGLAKSQEA